jgi:hypothetical protein
VGVAQLARSFASIAPLATFQYLQDIGVTSIGMMPLQGIESASWLKLLWVPALTVSLLFVILKGSKLEPSTPSMIQGCLIIYLTYLLMAPSISEQLFELVLIMILFLAAFSGLKRSSITSYAVGSLIVLLFLTFHVPITSFVFPIYPIDRTPLASFGKIFLPWLTLIFGCYLIAEINITARDLAHW